MSKKDNNVSVNFVADFEGNIEQFLNVEFPDTLPLLPLRNMMLFPTVMLPVNVTRKSSYKVIKNAERHGSIIGVFCQKHPDTESPLTDDLYPIGVAARIIKIIEMPDGHNTVILQGLSRIMLREVVRTRANAMVTVQKQKEVEPGENNMEFNLLMTDCRKRAERLLEMSEEMGREAQFAIKNIRNDIFYINFLCCTFPFNIEDKWKLLKEDTLMGRSILLMRTMSMEIQFSEIRNNLKQKTQMDLNNQQREYFLQQQMKNIQEELGTGADTIRDVEFLREKASNKIWNSEVEIIFQRELTKLERLHPQSPDYNMQLTYLQTILQLPWNECTKDYLNINNAEKVLDSDHYGMEKVKERILEHLAVLKLRGDLKSPIICLYGPPGVGKTSLGRSIAASLKRKYVRVSLGGLHDEAEIRGHRRTYIGAMPGRVIQNIIKAGSSNPVFILDEIDKITQTTTHGDPASALLEVLDPEQNSTFHDNYLDIDYDLSKVLFIATANNISTIPQPLQDRMELIEVNGYLTEEKVEIARKHLIPKEKENNGLAQYKKLNISKTALERIIEDYTRESGVRGLEKQISKIFRKLALNYARKKEVDFSTVKPEHLNDLLGKPPYNRDKYQGNDTAGVVTGLAWTSVGGEILFIETSLSRGKGNKLTLTGNLGDVMKESAVLALEYIKAHADMLNLDMRIFDNYNIHIHVPEGATPKDGPSAGVTMATSLASALTQRKVHNKVAMTGEITLRGKVLPVGGIKEKILAAKRAGITDIVICQDNRKDIEDIPAIYLEGVTFHYVEYVSQVFDFALLKEKVKNPVEFKYEEEKNVAAT